MRRALYSQRARKAPFIPASRGHGASLLTSRNSMSRPRLGQPRLGLHTARSRRFTTLGLPQIDALVAVERRNSESSASSRPPTRAVCSFTSSNVGSRSGSRGLRSVGRGRPTATALRSSSPTPDRDMVMAGHGKQHGFALWVADESIASGRRRRLVRKYLEPPSTASRHRSLLLSGWTPTLSWWGPHVK